jgi:hypothetical protein
VEAQPDASAAAASAQASRGAIRRAMGAPAGALEELRGLRRAR